MGYEVKPSKIWFFQAITPAHMGAGQGLDHIDLPIQREQHTKFPIFYASGIKGAIREQALEIVKNKEECKDLSLSQIDSAIEKAEEFEKLEGDCKQIVKELREIFGSQDNKGKLTVSDAKILFFPVKSLKGIFAYVTCPFVLKRYAEDINNDELLELVKEFEPEEGKVFARKTLEVENSKVILEEFEFENKGEPNGIVDNLKLPNGLREKILERAAIVDDDTFSYFVENYTEVVNRIKINPETGTVDKVKGALWTEEYLPAESVLYSLIFTEGELNSEYLPSNGSVIVLGGNQTVGKGIVKIYEEEV
jgi:CRISPR-associated protein Cmr4